MDQPDPPKSYPASINHVMGYHNVTKGNDHEQD
jgi:hypothetical protein